MSCRPIGKLLGLLLALSLTGCRAYPDLKPDLIVDIPLNPTEAVTAPAAESIPPETAAETQPVTVPETEPPTEPPTEAAPPVFAEQGITDPPPTESRLVKTTELARRVAEAVNARRVDAGLEPLTVDPGLCAMADRRTLEQPEHFGHIRPDGSSWQTVLGSHSYGFTSELLYYGSETAIVDRWMRTGTQRQDLLADAAAVMGAAAYTAGDTIYVVVILAG